ncbi:aldo/keto reductase, diketogulonate reductase [Corynebacterium mustelae]|uniref:Aldo/keto reductase, diketogulonate reductase n=1 Tax=Corynebacterium mustelae TaxID=571915 RepID=A0A0G3GVT1_9CORY|nr:aldo/keto reductase [Corynebacterium mustelae]AKK05286.1 aldo/keto reductase, diketogulonate reductase [Corynebacterium mustelae]
MAVKNIPSFTLNDGTEMPAIGFGTWKITGPEAVGIVRSAIELGYRHIDTAAIYGNEVEVGKAINDAIAAGDVTRDELFITSKLWHDHHGEGLVQTAFQKSLADLGLDYLDCYMVHWPWPQGGKYVESFAAIAKIQGLGQLQSVAVANFNAEQLSDIHRETGVVPVLNQIELHPGFSQAQMRSAHEELGIITEAWSPLARGDVLENPVIVEIAHHRGKTPGQVVLRWLYQLGVSTVPKSANPDRQAENLALFDWELGEEEIAALTALDESDIAGRMYADPAEFPGELG